MFAYPYWRSLVCFTHRTADLLHHHRHLVALFLVSSCVHWRFTKFSFLHPSQTISQVLSLVVHRTQISTENDENFSARAAKLFMNIISSIFLLFSEDWLWAKNIYLYRGMFRAREKKSLSQLTDSRSLRKKEREFNWDWTCGCRSEIMEDLFVNCFCLAALTRPPRPKRLVVGRETNFLMNISWFSFSLLVCERAFLVGTKNWVATCAMDGRRNVDSAVTVLPTIWLANLSRHGVKKSSCRALRVTHVFFLTNYQEFRSYFSRDFFFLLTVVWFTWDDNLHAATS